MIDCARAWALGLPATGARCTERPARTFYRTRRRNVPLKDPEKRRAYQATWYAANREQQWAYGVANREKRRARNAAYRAANREMIRARGIAYYAANREKVRFHVSAYCVANQEKVNARAAAYRAEHPVEAAANTAKRRAMKRKSIAGDPATIKAVYRRAREEKNVNCYLCGKSIPFGERHVDHVWPLAKKGPHTASNLAIVHKRCNQTKGAKHPNEVGVLL